MAEKKKEIPTVEIKNCFKCGKPVSEDEFCHGCKSYVCDECDVNSINIFGKHQREDHLIEENEVDA